MYLKEQNLQLPKKGKQKIKMRRYTLFLQQKVSIN
ncbi:hypothetical protein IMSAGC020_02182 [Lachnospiraceae bacterium]|nr:hypothetical protein IMSAGC020_02182 [Lachnospiraceae bacterium]